LSGTPTQSGSHSNIVISVSDGTDMVSLPGFSIHVNASTGSFSLSWTAPTTREDGTAIALSEIGGYRIYYGDAPGNFTNTVDIADGSVTTATVSDIPSGDYYVAMSTVDTGGNVSALSSAVSKQAQ
ncbi:MAG: fibronectin type III domain-containing protein, partial [Gammaproteobacteria bacterium]|nr:fibronectin type III domain-containing protein [Gammaproteobacteria bacterium]